MKRFGRYASLLGAAVLVSCGARAAVIVTSSPSVRPAATAPAAATAVPAHVWIRSGRTSGVSVLDTRTHQLSASVPKGVLSRDWSREYSVTQSGATRLLTAFDPATGATLESAQIAAGYILPTLGPSERPLGLSPNGRHLVLSGQADDTGVPVAESRFLVYDTTRLAGTPVAARVSGHFIFDGISDNGRNLYLLQLLTNGTDEVTRYHIRHYDLATGALDSTILADKRTGERQLSGAPVDQLTSADGAWQYTVYAFGSSAPFVHALNLDDAATFCIDLPRAPVDQSMDLLWGLAAAHDGRSVYAVNGGNGSVVRMSAARPWETRTASFTVPTPVRTESWIPGAPVVAEAKRITFGSVVITPDDRTLYALGNRGIVSIEAASLSRTGGTLLPDMPLTSLVISDDGAMLYATQAEGPELLEVQPRTGAWVPLAAEADAFTVLRATA